MLSDEEKKALYMISLRRKGIPPNGGFIADNEEITIILNLIEKQSKEIEELKAISEYREKIIKGLGLKTLPKTITGFKELIENNDKKWEDKIKAMLENEIINISGFECVAKEDVQSLLEKE